MGTWNSRGLRGSTLEDMVNRTNEWYLEKNLALMQKIPTPITPVRMDKEHRQITLAYFDQRSTIDYIGAVQGIPVCFDAKECVAETFPLQNIHEHQVEFMKNFEKQQGIAFILIYYSSRNILYYMRFEELYKFWMRAQNGGRKSFRFDELDERFFMKFFRGCYVPYLDALNLDYEYLDGHTPALERVRLVMEFNAGTQPVFLISLKAGGTGLNLTGADMVIHYDPWWNPAVEDQATDRAYRIGQKNNVQVLKFITKDTIEEKIFALQEKKKALIDQMVKPGENFLSKLSEDEIRDLFSGR